MFPVLARILGSDKVIEKGLELIDDAWETDAEATQAKAEAKIALMGAYAPFKVAQRYLAMMFSIVFLGCFVLVLAMTLSGELTDPVFQVIDEFKIDWIMTTIILFYFGGGLAESIGRGKRGE